MRSLNPDNKEDKELISLIEKDIITASGHFEYLSEVKVIETGKETDDWYRKNEQFGALSFFHTLSNGKSYHVRVCQGD